MKKIFLVFTFIFVLINNAFTQQKLESVSEIKDYSYLIYKYDLKPDFNLVNENELINVGSSYKPTQDWFYIIEPQIIKAVKNKDEIFFGYSQINFLDLENYLNYKNYHEMLSEQITKNILQQKERVEQWQKAEKERDRKETIGTITRATMLISGLACVFAGAFNFCNDPFCDSCDKCSSASGLTSLGAVLFSCGFYWWLGRIIF